MGPNQAEDMSLLGSLPFFRTRNLTIDSAGKRKAKHMNQLLSFKSLRLLPLTAIALLLGHFSAFAGSNTNTSLGLGALPGNTKGTQNTGLGYQALHVNSTGNNNTATGAGALANNTMGQNNTATGEESLASSIMSFGNTATGDHSLFANSDGANNTAIGQAALRNSTTGSNNIAVGSRAGDFLDTGNNNIDIGNEGGGPAEANTIRIGDSNQTRTFITGISGTAVMGGVGVVVDANGQLGVAPSSRRFKEDIKPMDKASEALFALEPVIFRYKSSIDSCHTRQFGLVAEDVEKVNPDLVVRDKQARIYTVRYDAVNAMLLNEFLKEHKTVKEQGATIACLEKQIEALTVSVKEQAAQIQKVSAQVEASRPAVRTIASR
jgi:hypothetical protein